MRIENPYHEGELLVQQRVGEVEEGRRNGRAIADTIVKGAFRFIEQQPMVVLGSLDQQAKVWASLLFGPPGFMRVPEERTVELDLRHIARNPQDPLWANIEHDSRLGMLFIELSTRRRLRINGRIASNGADHVLIEVDEAYPNCPKYIQRRHLRGISAGGSFAMSEVQRGTAFRPEQMALIRRADTFFVATAHPSRGTDVSHRGGNPAFAKVLDEATLRIPDYRGNSMFNTLGNLAVNPNAGLVFPDFENRRVLQLTGTAEILWDQPDTAGESGGTGRFWHFHSEYWLETQLPGWIAWEFLDYSPHNPRPEK